MNRYKGYAKYKDSGVEWIGEVPEHWSVLRLANIGPLMKANGGNRQDDADSGIPCIRYGDLYTTYDFLIRDIKKFISNESEPNYTPIQHGDILFAASGETFEEIGKSAVNLDECCAYCGGDIIVLRPQRQIDAVFLGYAAGSSSAQAQKSMMGKGFTVIHLYGDQLRNLVIAVPSEQEQKLIGDRIETETGRVDALITKKTRFIELLKEKRSALITHAVTKGIDPNVKMKDSGVAWIGEVPESWIVSRLSRFASIENGTTPGRQEDAFWKEGTVPWIGSREVNQIHVTVAHEFVTESALRACSLRLLPIGTIIIAMVGQGKTRGMAAILDIEAAINQNLAAVLVGPKIRPLFLLYVFHAAYDWIREAGRGSNQAAMNCEIVGEFRLALPLLAEQNAILKYIKRDTARLDVLTEKTERSIGLLKERRSALITAAVTGQIDVRRSI